MFNPYIYMNNSDSEKNVTILQVCNIKLPFSFIKRNIIYLLDKGANLNLQDNYGNTALIIACHNNNTEIVNLLIENKTNLDLQDNDGWTALIYACYKNNTELVKILIDKGANLDLQDKNGCTALMLLSRKRRTAPSWIRYDCYVELLSLMLEYLK